MAAACILFDTNVDVEQESQGRHLVRAAAATKFVAQANLVAAGTITL
jgi:hypothetical protein